MQTFELNRACKLKGLDLSATFNIEGVQLLFSIQLSAKFQGV